jgi:hypothetical protein
LIKKLGKFEKNSRKQPTKRGKEEKWQDKSKALLYFMDQFYNPFPAVDGRLLHVSGCGKFNKHQFEYKEKKEVALSVKTAALESGHSSSLSDISIQTS